MLAHKIAALARDLAANAEDPERIRAVAAVLQSYASLLRDQEREVVPPHVRGLDQPGVVVLRDWRAVR